MCAKICLIFLSLSGTHQVKVLKSEIYLTVKWGLFTNFITLKNFNPCSRVHVSFRWDARQHNTEEHHSSSRRSEIDFFYILFSVASRFLTPLSSSSLRPRRVRVKGDADEREKWEVESFRCLAKASDAAPAMSLFHFSQVFTLHSPYSSGCPVVIFLADKRKRSRTSQALAALSHLAVEIQQTSFYVWINPCSTCWWPRRVLETQN
jgi:hypothetical protein